MKIIDVNGKEREAKDLEIVTHNRSNSVTVVKKENIDGELVDVSEDKIVDVEEKYMKVTIVGNKSNWTEWYPLKKFEELNPEVHI